MMQNISILEPSESDLDQVAALLKELMDVMVVSRICRRKGIGGRLVTQAIKKCQWLGCCEIEVGTEKVNKNAREFYKRCGFVEDAVLLEAHFL